MSVAIKSTMKIVISDLRKFDSLTSSNDQSMKITEKNDIKSESHCIKCLTWSYHKRQLNTNNCRFMLAVEAETNSVVKFFSQSNSNRRLSWHRPH